MVWKKNRSKTYTSEKVSYLITNQLGQMEHLFAWMSHCFFLQDRDAQNQKSEKIQTILDYVSNSYCDTCQKSSMCQRHMEQALKTDGSITKEDIVSFLTCRGGDEMIVDINQMYRHALLEIRMEQQIHMHQQFLSDQYQIMAQMIRECMQLYDDGYEDETEQESSKIIEVASKKGIVIKEICISKKKGAFILQVYGRVKRGERKSRDVADLFSDLYQKRLKPTKRCRMVMAGQDVWMEFEEKARFHVIYGSSRESCQGEKDCGEQFTLETIGEHRFIAAICDGLGTGTLAGNESRRTIELLETLLEQGMSSKMAIEMLRMSLLFSPVHERYVTLDYMCIDLHTGIASLLKLGSAETFLIRGCTIEVIEGNAPPIGVATKDVPFIRKKLITGDKIIMVSDGVLDEFGGKESFLTYLEEIKTLHPQKLCDHISERLTKEKDDCTILAMSVWNQ